jgi:hypothetical protein
VSAVAGSWGARWTHLTRPAWLARWPGVRRGNGFGRDGRGGGDRPGPDQGGAGHQLGRYRQAVASDRTGAEPEDVIAGGGAGAESALPGMTSSRGCPADHPGVACLGNEGLSARQVRPVEGRLRTAAVRPGSLASCGRPGRSARGWTSTLSRQPPKAEPGKPGALAPRRACHPGRPAGSSYPPSGVSVMLASPSGLVVAFGRVAARTLLPGR